MKHLLMFLLVLVCNRSFAQNTLFNAGALPAPLADYSPEWNKPEYASCNTAVKVNYMNDKERTVIYILNLARTNPKLFAGTVLAKYPTLSGNDDLINDQYYYQSLVNLMRKMDRMPLLYPDEKCFQSAACHCKISGKSGYTGHDRISAACKAKEYFSAECCDYGNEDPLEIVLSLLIDKDVPSLGHRRALLGNYTKVGVSIQPHKTYNFNSVLDFNY
jgi:uncharacterized protein YkwD